MKTGLTAMLSFLLIFSNSAFAVVSLLPPPSAAPTPATAPSLVSINPAANTGQGSQNGGAGANDGIGAALMAMGAMMMANPATMPMGAALMAMGALALAQGAADSDAANQSGQTAATSATTGSGTTTPAATATPVTDGGVLAGFQTPAGQQALAALTAAGGSVSADGVTMPDGTTKSWSAFSSGASLSANGFDGAGIMKTVSALERKFGVDGAGNAGQGTAIADSPGGSAKSAAEITMPKFTNPFAMNANDKAKIAAGKTVTTAGGDPIGVQMDNLFGMIHRAYDRQRATSNFIDNPAGKTADDESVTASLLGAPGRTGKFGNSLIKRAPASVDVGGH